MKEKTRNLAVGLTVIIGLSILAGVIFAFTGMAGFLATGYVVYVEMDSSHGVTAGDWVNFKGIKVGKVTEVSFTEGDPRKGVTFKLRVNRDYRLPGTTKLMIFTRGLAGSAYLDLQTGGEPYVTESGAKPEYLPMDQAVRIHGEYSPGSLIPDEVQDALGTIGELGEQIGPTMKEFGDLARNLNRLIGGTSQDQQEDGQDPGADGQPDGQPAQPNLRETFAKLDTVLSGMATFFGDKENQENLSKTLEGMAKASDAARGAVAQIEKLASQAQGLVRKAGDATESVRQAADNAGKRVDEISESLLTQAEDLSRMLQTLHKAAKKLENGEGTAGKLLNDAKLYDNLVEATAQLDKLAKELRGLVKTWKETGLQVDLK
jgi:phospholipid/cholesterol/gamma-HCH transport system substrate-binding protein